MRQILIEGAQLLRDANIFEQGFGKLDLLESFALLQVIIILSFSKVLLFFFVLKEKKKMAQISDIFMNV
jgi:hypothetical protein